MDRGEVEIEEARQMRGRRASDLTTDREKDECEVMRTVLRNWCNSCVRRTCETIPRMSNKCSVKAVDGQGLQRFHTQYE